MVRLLIFFIKIYQRKAPVRLRSCCRFVPSCSNYIILAFEKHGFFKGSLMGVLRLMRCKAPNGGVDFP